MKKLLFITLGLAALFGLTACVEQQNVSPTFNPVDNTINTQFVFNISALSESSNPSTKQADTNVQAKGNFRGIDNATLFAVIDSNMNTASAPQRKKMVEPTENAAAMRDLSSILAKDAIPSGQDGGTRIVEINLPVGTNELVFYAKAAKQDIPGLDSKELYGSLQYTTTTDQYINLKNMIGSYAERRLAAKDSSAYSTLQALIVRSFNGLFRTTVKGESDSLAWYEKRLTDSEKEVHFGDKTYTVKTLRWADYACAGTDDNSAISPFFKDPISGQPLPASELERILGMSYTAFSSPKYEHDIRGGSGLSTARTMADLYNLAQSGAHATPLNLQEAVAQLVFQKLVTNIEKLSDPITGSLTGERVWKSVTSVKNVVGLSSVSISEEYNINRFPAQEHMPDGSSTLGLDSLDVIPNPLLPPQAGGGVTRILQLKYVSALDTLFNGSGSTPKNLYTYTPELCYYGNSSIRTSESNTLSNLSFPTHADWGDATKWSGGTWKADGSPITSSTRGVAMSNTIQYGISLLGSKLVLSSKNLTDNGTLGGQTKTITLDNSHFLLWTGILVGGQPEQVGWDYLLNMSSGIKAGSNAIVYDKINYRRSEATGLDTVGVAITDAGYVGGSDESSAFTNYTLLYDNVDPYAPDDSQQGDVYVALEFVNRLGQDFWGKQGLIRDGATFYLFAKLTPTPAAPDDRVEVFWNNVFNGAFNNNNLLPPYQADGTTRPIRRVFVQDIKTGVTFRFNSDALSNAYIAIPDLRSAKLSLGMNVDLNWTAGLTYEAPLGTR